MIKEDYVSYEVAKLLKEKRFNESCYSFYLLLNNGDYRYIISDFPYKNSCKYNVPSLARPTHQMAMKWLREEGFIISVEPRYPNGEQKYCYDLWVNGVHRDYRGLLYDTYEEAVEAALKYCLTELI